MLLEYSYLIPLLPLIAGLLIIFFTKANRILSASLSIGAVALAFIYSLAIFFGFSGETYQVNSAWLAIGNFKLFFGLLIDQLAIVMLLVVTSVSLLVQIYSHGYMSHDNGYSKFFSFLSLFTASMLALVLSTNLFQLYVFWELVGLCSYLLIGFWHERPLAGPAALKAFVVNRIGDFGFLIGLLLLAFFSINTGSYSPESSLIFLGFEDLPAHLKNIPHPTIAIIGLLVLMGAMAKSAQFPLHTWLPDAMEGPTPISALIHAATMVAAGVYLLARAFPLYNYDPEGLSISLVVIAVLGAFTALYAAIIALSQYDIKKALAYSTMSQLGLMVMSVGCGAWIPAIFHLVTHAYFKSLLFLGSGSVIHGCDEEQDMREFGGLHSKMPITSWTFLIGTMAISAVPLLSGFWSKEQILHSAWHFGEGASQAVFAVSVIASMLTCFYMFRIYFMTFTGEYRGKAHPHESPLSMTLPLVILTIPSVLLGYIGTNLKAFGGNHFAEYLGEHAHHAESIAVFIMKLFSEIETIIPVLGTAIFISLAVFTYYIPRLDKFKSRIKGSFIYDWSFNKFYLDEFYAMLVNKLIMPFSRALHNVFERAILNNAIIEGFFGSFQLWRAKMLSHLTQNGQVQSYLLFTLIIFCILYIATIQGPAVNIGQLQSKISQIKQTLNQGK